MLDLRDQRVVATPFPKFFNVSERPDEPIPRVPFSVFEKIDGSLIILFYRDGWHATTKGAFNTVQAKQAEKLLTNLDGLCQGDTYLLEYVGPDNRIIIDYPEPALYLLSAYDEDGEELNYDTLDAAADTFGWKRPVRHRFASFVDMVEKTKLLPASQEGFVVEFETGLRLKIKGDEYCRIHALVSRITPLGVWEILRSGDDMALVKQSIPEEFWTDFDAIRELIENRVNRLWEDIVQVSEEVAQLSDKQLGLQLTTHPDWVRSFLFPYRKAAGNRSQPKLKELLYRAMRPDGNLLPGYVPSYMMGRLQEEAS